MERYDLTEFWKSIAEIAADELEGSEDDPETVVENILHRFYGLKFSRHISGSLLPAECSHALSVLLDQCPNCGMFVLTGDLYENQFEDMVCDYCDEDYA